MASTSKITIRGEITENGATKSVTLATFTNLSTSNVQSELNTATQVTNFLKSIQAVTSVKVTGITIATAPQFEVEDIGTPGDPLDSAEIFSEEYSDTAVVPTLNVVNITDNAKNRSFNVKYMADPVNTTSFDEKVQSLASKLGDLSDTYFVSANLTFTAKDEITRAS